MPLARNHGSSAAATLMVQAEHNTRIAPVVCGVACDSSVFDLVRLPSDADWSQLAHMRASSQPGGVLRGAGSSRGVSVFRQAAGLCIAVHCVNGQRQSRTARVRTVEPAPDCTRDALQGSLRTHACSGPSLQNVHSE